MSDANLGTITVYLGKIKRESCIAQIARYIGADMEEMPEKSYDGDRGGQFSDR